MRLFVTLVRFDAAYNGLFKCNLRRLVDYPALSRYLNRMLSVPASARRSASTTSSVAIIRSGHSIRAVSFPRPRTQGLASTRDDTCSKYPCHHASRRRFQRSSDQPLAGVWRDRLPGRFCFPMREPLPVSAQGTSGSSVAGVTEENRPARISEARASFDATISAIIEGSGFSGRLDRVALVGFSQGTIMALDAIASGRWPVGAVVGFSGRLASPQPLKPSVSTKVLLVHGSADPVIPAAETAKAAAILQAVGVAVETMTLPGLGHTISAEGAERAADFMSDTLAK